MKFKLQNVLIILFAVIFNATDALKEDVRQLIVHPKLQALPNQERYRDYYKTIEYGYAWITGYRPYLYWENTTDCFQRMTNESYIGLPVYRTKFALAKKQGNLFDQVNLTTTLISNISLDCLHCNSMLTSASQYWMANLQQYKQFEIPVLTFLLSWIQNMLANTISIMNIYTSINQNMKSGNRTGVQYDCARLLRTLTIFSPIQPIEDYYYYDPKNPDPDLNTQKQKLIKEDEDQWVAISVQHFMKLLIEKFPKNAFRLRQDQQIGLDAITWTPLPILNSTDTPPPNGNTTGTPPRVVYPVNSTVSTNLTDNTTSTPYQDDLPTGYDQTVGELFSSGPDWSKADFLNVRSIFDLSVGFFNATQLLFGQNRTICQFSVQNQTRAGQQVWEILQSGFTYFNILNATNSFLTIGQLTQNSTFGCYYGATELKYLSQMYATSMQNTGILFFNLFFNSGTIINCVRNLVLYFYGRDYTSVKNAFQFGTEMGQIFWYIFYPVRIYIKSTLDSGGTFQQNWTWDNKIK